MQLTFTETRAASFAASDTARRWLAPGLAAGAGFLAIEMLAGSFTTSIWSFPESIAQTIGIGSPTRDLDPAQLLAGIVLHLAFSVCLGAMFVALAERFRVTGVKLLASAVLFMWAESAISIWLVLHTFFPATLPVLLGAVPFWASFAGRTSFGVMLAIVYSHQAASSTTGQP